MLSNFLPTLALALTANAFLIPPDVSGTSWENTVATQTNGATQRQALSLDCSSCPFAALDKNDGPITWVHGIENSLRMEFLVEDKQLSLNGVPFYPPSFDKGPAFMSAKQELKPGVELQSSLPFDGALPLSTQIEVEGTQMVKGDDGIMRIHRISLETMGISDKVVRVPTIKIGLVEVNEKFYLLPIEIAPYKPVPGSENCATIFCRVKASIAAKIAALKAMATSRLGSFRGGCRGKFGHSSKLGPKVKGGLPKFIGKFPSKHGHHGFHGFSQNGHFHHHGHYHGHHRHSPFHLFFNFIKAVMVPIFVGIIVGVAVGGIGLFVGQAVVFIWARCRGVNSHTYDQISQEENANVDSPPKYEEVYEALADSNADEKNTLN